MCGIAAIIDFNNSFNDGHINSLLNSINHRGPDDKNFIKTNNVFLGMTRLSIIDLKKGAQPMITDCKKSIVDFASKQTSLNT